MIGLNLIAMALAIGADTQLGGTDAKDLLSVVIRAWEINRCNSSTY